jgi:hypothetical protein
MCTEREIKLFSAFTNPSKHERYTTLLCSPKGRAKVCKSLDHFGDLDLRYCKKLPGAKHSQSHISALLRSLGAPPVCYVISSNSDVDGMELQLDDALGLVVGIGRGTFLCCIPGALAYFEGESAGERYLCRREIVNPTRGPRQD